ncbi:phenylacetate--CoA ligase family protein [bacterium]|nr:MAG: phenylacetate--CoA ligase family protein [bacterium]
MDPGGAFAKHLLFPLQCLWERNTVPRHLADLEQTQWRTQDEIRDLQLGRMQHLLDHAYGNSPFWRRRLDAAGFGPGDLTSLEQVAELPVLTKQDIREHAQAMVDTTADTSKLMRDKTGGSTGEPLNFMRTADRDSSRVAAAIRHDRWTGWDIGDKAAYIWGHPRDLAAQASRRRQLRRRFLERRIILDTSSLSRDRLAEFRDELLDFRPVVYIAYANSLYLYARFLEETGGDWHRPGAVITSAEVLDPDRRAVIERVFDCKVFDRYGSRETGVIASECEAHDGMHLCAEHLYVEFARDGRPVAPGEQGRLLVTDLSNPVMPFIRYEIGDVGAPHAGGACTCGRGLPRMEMAAGRVTDFLLTPAGSIVSGAALTIYLIANAPGVAQAQLVQEVRERILIRVVAGEGYGDATHAFFAQQIPRFFGPDMKYDVEEVAGIPSEASGKHRFSICKLDPTELF